MNYEELTIAQVREFLGMTQGEFAYFFDIPIGTIRNWEQGKSKAPNYVYSMIFMIIERDKMINIETIKFYKMLDELAEKAKNGIISFDEAKSNYDIDKNVVYDKKKINENGTYKIVLDAFMDDHHDAISFYGYDSSEYIIGVRIEDDTDKKWIEVSMLRSKNEIVIDSNGWYFAS